MTLIASFIFGENSTGGAIKDYVSPAYVRNMLRAKLIGLGPPYNTRSTKGNMTQKEAQAQVDRMSETLRTLNGIFRDIQMDADMVKSADIKGQNDRLERELLNGPR